MTEEMQELQTEIDRYDTNIRSLPDGDENKQCQAARNELQAKLDALRPRVTIADMEAAAEAREAEAAQLVIAQNAPFTGEIPVA